MDNIKKISNKSKHKKIQKQIRLKKLEKQLKANIFKRKKKCANKKWIELLFVVKLIYLAQ